MVTPLLLHSADRTANLHLTASLNELDLDDLALSLCSQYPGPQLDDRAVLWLPCSVRQALFFKLFIMGYETFGVAEVEVYLFPT